MSIIPTTIKSKELVEKRREQIVQAAIKLFPKKGYHKTTLRDLADEAGISHGNIYDYVGNKEDIFLMVHRTITGLADECLVRSTENIGDPLEKLNRMIRSELDLSQTWSDGILFVYQDIHVLSRPLLKKLLKKESDHVARFKSVLDECISNGLLRDCNTRLVANLIKIMIDSWVIKRWDLRGISASEMENSIRDLVFNGLRNGEADKSRKKMEGIEHLKGKLILVLNGGTVLGKAISSSLLSKGARLGVYSYGSDTPVDKELGISTGNWRDSVRFYSLKENGPVTPHLFRKIVNDFGQIDIVIQDLGISDIEKQNSKRVMEVGLVRLDENFSYARNLFATIEAEMSKRGSGRILYLAPWAWVRHIDRLRYEIAIAESVILTQTLAKKMAGTGVTVNCIIPGYIGGVKNLWVENKESRDLIGHISKGHLGEVQDILDAVHYVISDRARYLTGQVLRLNGGIA